MVTQKKNLHCKERDYMCAEKGNIERDWKFSKINAIEERIFNPLLETFVKYGLSGLVRENIQNALDAKLPGSSNPVDVMIQTGEINADDILGIGLIRERISCLEGGNIYAADTVKHMRTQLNKKTVPYISFEDQNTKGLTRDNWNYYAYQKGAHYIESDTDFESTRGGSHGVGKIASNAASDIHMMFFANCDEDGVQQLGGTIQLLEHECRGQTYRATGYFTDGEAETGYVPYKNQASDVFQKKSRGLKIVVPFLKTEYNDSNKIIQAVCDNFFMAVLEENLVVTVNNQKIDAGTILEIIQNPEVYPQQDPSAMRDNFTPLYVSSYLEVASVPFVVKDKHKEYNFKLHFRFDEAIGRGRVGIIRTIGMKIEDFQVAGYSKMPFNAVLIPASATEDAFLKSLENESHTKLTYNTIRDEAARSNAKRFINNLNKALAAFISAKYKESNPTDDKIDTSDLLYSVESTFKKVLESKATTISITPAGNSKKTLLVKKKKNPTTQGGKPPNPKPRVPPTPRPRKNKNLEGEDGKRSTFTYPVRTSQVKRVLMGNREEVIIQLTGNPNYNGETMCNLHYKVVDGQGKTVDNAMDLAQYYETVLDKELQQNCLFSDNRINKISIKNGKIALQMRLTAHANRALKFVYYAEVSE